MPASLHCNELLEARIKAVARTLPGVRLGDPRALHRARTASRRLRELIPVLGLRRSLTAKLVRRLRKARRRLGVVREFDVLLLLVADLRASGEYADAGLQRVAAQLDVWRGEAWSPEVGKRAAEAFSSIIGALKDEGLGRRNSAAARSDPRVWRWALEARVVRRVAPLKEAIEEAGTAYSPAQLHAVRIALKKVRYGVELALDVSAAPSDPDLAVLKRVQAILGGMHDREILMDRVRQVQGLKSADGLALRRDLDELLSDLETSCRRLHAKYVREREGLLAICQKRASKATRQGRQAAARRAG